MKKIGKGLSEVDAKVKRLEGKYNKTLEEKAMLTIELTKAEETIVVAENLVGKLEGEYQRWSGQACIISTAISTTGLLYSSLFHTNCVVFPSKGFTDDISTVPFS